MPEKRSEKDEVDVIFKQLKDESRMKIFVYLMTNEKLTLKQLSEALNKGKTTIHHHIKRLEEVGIIGWEERKEEKKKLKTRDYYVIKEKLEKLFGLESESQ